MCGSACHAALPQLDGNSSMASRTSIGFVPVKAVMTSMISSAGRSPKGCLPL